LKTFLKAYPGGLTPVVHTRFKILLYPAAANFQSRHPLSFPGEAFLQCGYPLFHTPVKTLRNLTITFNSKITILYSYIYPK
jgi:hypothetical protein